MRNIKIVIAYDGTKYNGWQRQDSTQNTIQGKLETLISRMTGEEIRIDGSGRTDAGVHANGQVANFRTETTMTTEDMKDYMNEYLPRDIAILDVRDASERFHSRLNVKRKTYIYHLHQGKGKEVFMRNYVYHIQDRLDVEKMRQAIPFLLGTHDFKSFCTKKRMKKSTVRMIESIEILQDGDDLQFVYKGNGFLYNMVRILTGTLIEIGRGEKAPEEIPAILEAKERAKAGFMAPAMGLFLEKVDY